jgi:hypothetical protein
VTSHWGKRARHKWEQPGGKQAVYICKRGGFCRKPAGQTRTTNPLDSPTRARIRKRCYAGLNRDPAAPRRPQKRGSTPPPRRIGRKGIAAAAIPAATTIPSAHVVGRSRGPRRPHDRALDRRRRHHHLFHDLPRFLMSHGVTGSLRAATDGRRRISSSLSSPSRATIPSARSTSNQRQGQQ